MQDEKRRLEERLEQLRAEKERLLYEVQHRGRPLDDGDDRSAIRRGLQAGPSQPYHRADSSTGSSETGTPAQSDSPPASLLPGPPSSSDRTCSKSGKSGKGTRNSSRAVHDKSKTPPPTWAELDAQFYAESAAESSAKQGLAPGAPSSTAGGLPPAQPGLPPAQPGLPPAQPALPRLCQCRLPLGRNSRTDGSTQKGPQGRRLSRGCRLAAPMRATRGPEGHPWTNPPLGRISLHSITQRWPQGASLWRPSRGWSWEAPRRSSWPQRRR